jgi:hypothetical protein
MRRYKLCISVDGDECPHIARSARIIEQRHVSLLITGVH